MSTGSEVARAVITDLKWFKCIITIKLNLSCLLLWVFQCTLFVLAENSKLPGGFGYATPINFIGSWALKIFSKIAVLLSVLVRFIAHTGRTVWILLPQARAETCFASHMWAHVLRGGAHLSEFLWIVASRQADLQTRYLWTDDTGLF